MILHTQRLTLRPMDQTLLHSTHAYAGDVDNTRFMMFLPYADLNETAAYLQDAEAQWQMPQPERYEYAIFLGEEHIGTITLYMQEDRSVAELGWVLHRDHWRRGYVTEAALGLIAFAKTIGVRRIFACCDSENVASWKTMEKLGMTLARADGVRTNRSMGEARRVEWTYEMKL